MFQPCWKPRIENTISSSETGISASVSSPSNGSGSGGESNPVSGQASGLFLDGLPVVGCALIASLWDRLADAMRWTIARPMSLLVTVNVLNLADAVLTRFAVSAGSAVELNPVVRLIGLPAKLVLVGLLSWLLYRRRPATLLIPAAVLLVVLAYHVSGLIIDG